MSASRSALSNVSDRPSGVFLFPSDPLTVSACSRTDTMAVRVVVLPTDPVIATTRHPSSRTRAEAASTSAPTVLSTWRTSTPSGTSAGSSTQTAVAPLATASSTKAWPSWVSPRMAT